MTKTLEQIQEENRKAIIMANNPSAKSYEEALEMDQKPIRKALLENLVSAYWCYRVWEAWSYGTMTKYDFEEIGEGDDGFEDLVDDLYKPLTLNRVLIALTQINYNMTSWDLTKETLEEQSEETQREINKLLI